MAIENIPRTHDLLRHGFLTRFILLGIDSSVEQVENPAIKWLVTSITVMPLLYMLAQLVWHVDIVVCRVNFSLDH